ncbi:MAG: DNA-directed DNA polymerase [Candidatus Aenigmarchaeota archaeon]|nr:DNA-directed DNA polymerase [Candidatus Aenigmarchaeota archaeon]
MQVKFQLLDVDYIMLDSKPVIRFFGRTDENKSITVFYEKFLPYFYVLPDDGKGQVVKDVLNEKFKDFLVKVETVERHLPIGFTESPIKLLKITLNNPAKTPLLREELRIEKSVREVFEADIPFRYRFMADHKIFGIRWYKATGNGMNTNIVKTEKKISAEKIEELDIEENMKFRYLSLDIEVVSGEGGLPDAEKDPIIMVSMYFYPAYKGKNSLVLSAKRIKQAEKDTIGFFSEKEMLQELIKIIDNFDPDIILGYNINNFDLPYIEARLRKNNLPRTIGRCNQKPIITRKFANRFRNNIVGRVVVDVYDLVKEATVKFGLFKGLKRYGLGDISRLVLGEDKIDISHSEINSHWADNGEKLKKLLDYSRKDAQLPLRILLKERMLDKFFELSKVTGILLQDTLEGGESIRIENLLLREFNEEKYVLPCKPDSDEISRRNSQRRTEGLKGALVLSPEIGFHDKCVVYLDFRSMYPNIISSFNICPTTLLLSDKKVEFLQASSGTKFVSPKIRKGIVPKIVRYLLDTRAKIKEQMDRARKPERKRYLYARQYAFKTVANAFYGHLGYIRAKLYVLDIANAITSTGREIINRTKDIVESKTPYKVIYADTDSVMVGLKTEDVKEAFKIGLEISKLINEEFKHMLELKIESVFKTLLILSKKRYAGWKFEFVDDKWEDSMITKGIETVRRDWCDLVSETLEEVLIAILKEQNINKAVRIVRDKIEDIKTGKIDIDKLVITKGVSKTLKSYKGIQPHIELVKKMRSRDVASAPGVGDRVGFVIVKGLQMISKRAEDPEYVKKHGLKIDSKYYIESQLLPPLERVFEALGVNKTDLMGIGKQLGLFDVMRKEAREEKPFEDYLTEIDGFICNNCNNVMRRVPLSGKCNYCNGEIVFFKGDKKSRVYDPWRLSVSKETIKEA